MKICLTTLLAAVLSASAGAAPPAQWDLPPPVLRDKGMKPLLRVRELLVPTLREIPGSVTCKIRYTDKYFGYLKDREYSLNYKMRLQSTCYDAKKIEWLNEMPLRFDTERREWVPDIEKRLQWAASAGGQEGADPEYKELRRNALRAYTVKSVNAQGFAFTEEDVTGEEKWRTRFIEYCLFHAEVALCGRGEVGYVAQGPRGDLTDYVLQILRSIEFLPNDPSVAPPAASAASAASASGH
jgi:hypothetical protein